MYYWIKNSSVNIYSRYIHAVVLFVLILTACNFPFSIITQMRDLKETYFESIRLFHFDTFNFPINNIFWADRYVCVIFHILWGTLGMKPETTKSLSIYINYKYNLSSWRNPGKETSGPENF